MGKASRRKRENRTLKGKGCSSSSSADVTREIQSAINLTRKGKFAEAYQKYQALDAQYQNNPDVLSSWAKTAASLGNFKEALRLFDRSKSLFEEYGDYAASWQCEEHIKQLMEAEDSVQFRSYMRAVSGNPDWTYPQREVPPNPEDLVLGIDKELRTLSRHSDCESRDSLWVKYFNGKRFGNSIFNVRTSKRVGLYDEPFIADEISTTLMSHGGLDDYLNILPLGTDYVAVFISFNEVLYNGDKKLVFHVCHIKHQNGEFVASKTTKISTERFLDFWKWAHIETDANGKEVIILSGYDPDDDAIIFYDTSSDSERSCRDFVVNRMIHDLKNEHRSKQIAMQSCPEENPTYVGEHNNISVLFFREKRRYVAVELKSKSILWEEDVEEAFYSSLYRGMLVSVREEYVEARNIDTGRIIAKTELSDENSWCYVNPVVFGGNLYLTTDDGLIWEVDIPNMIGSNNLTSNLDYKIHLEYEKASRDTDHSHSNKKLRKKFGNYHSRVTNANQISGFRCEKVLQFLSDSYYRSRPAVANDMMFLYHSVEIDTGKERILPIQIIRLKPNYAASAVRWLMKRMKVTSFGIIASYMGDPGDSNGIDLFERSLSRSLFRCRDYYEEMKQKAFLDVYCLSAREISAFSEIDPRVRFVSVEVAYREIYASLRRTFAYLGDFPDFNKLFFIDRTELTDLLKVDFDQSHPVFPLEALSERGRYVYHEIAEAGGLGQLEASDSTTYTSIMEKVRNLPSGDKSCLLEHDYFHSKRMHRARARETGLALFQAGKAVRALYYLFMSNCLPETEYDCKTKSMMPLLQAVCQLIYFGEGESKTSMLKKVDKDYVFEIDGLPQDFEFFFGLPCGGERLLRSFEVINNFVSLERISEANELVQRAVVELEDYLSQHENERLQVGTLLTIYEATIPRLISLNIDNDNKMEALQIYEGFKSLIMRRYLSHENRSALLDRLQNERFYKELRSRKAKIVSGKHGNRSAALFYSSENQTQHDQRFSLFAENHDSSTVDIKKLLKVLPAGAALVEYYFEDDRQGVFIAKKDDTYPQYVRLSENSLERCKEEIEGFTQEITRPGRDSNRISDHLRGMYNKLIKPIEEYLTDCTRLIIIPTKFLFHCPFTALSDGESYLIENYDVSISPSASIYSICAESPQISMDFLTLIIGNDKDLTGIGLEESFFKKMFGRNIDIVTTYPPPGELIEKTDILHFSGHGMFDENEPLLSSILVGSDDSVSVLDLYSLDLSKVSLAIINACVSGMSRVEAVDDIFGLVRGFFTAGCPTVVNTLWNLPDKVAPVFTSYFYSDLLQCGNPLSSFSRSIRILIRSNEFSSPHYWACYQYYGKGDS